MTGSFLFCQTKQLFHKAFAYTPAAVSRVDGYIVHAAFAGADIRAADAADHAVFFGHKIDPVWVSGK